MIKKYIKNLGVRKKVIYGIILMGFVLLLSLNYFPIKTAVYDRHLKQSKETIIIAEIDQSTGPGWNVIGNSKGLNDTDYESIFVSGNSPLKELSSGLFLSVQNKYVLYGEYKKFKKKDYDSSYRIFEVSSWDILYPVKRDSIVPSILPDKYLNPFDYLEHFFEPKY